MHEMESGWFDTCRNMFRVMFWIKCTTCTCDCILIMVISLVYHQFDPELTLDFTRKLETVQYSAALAVSGAWRGTNMCKLYEELGWECLYHRRWYRRSIRINKLKQSRLPDWIPPERELNYGLSSLFSNPHFPTGYGLRRANTFDQPIERTNRYSNTYFQNCPKEWNRLDISVQSS